MYVGLWLRSIIFNSAYTPALDLLRWRLLQLNIVFRLQSPDGAFWNTFPDVSNTSCDLVDATFVDDEAITLLASSPTAQKHAIEILLEI